jgi:hypothetical protein
MIKPKKQKPIELTLIFTLKGPTLFKIRISNLSLIICDQAIVF